MAEFSSCYFCGAALDAPLDEYPVVPSELHPSADQQSTVVLCPTCKSKLGAVIEAVIAAVETESGFEHDPTIDATLDGVTEAESSRGPGTGAEASPGTEEGPTTDAPPERADEALESPDGPESEMETTAESSEAPPTGESTGDRSPIFDGDSSADAAESDPYGPVFGDDEAGGDESDGEESGGARVGDRDVEGDEAGGGETAGDEAEDDETAGDEAEDDETAGDEAEGDETAGDEAEDDETAGDEAEDDETAGDEAEDDETAGDEIDGEETGGAAANSATETTESDDFMPDVRTYNRVIRLLQNREFPVDRDEIETVATNAYELSPAEFDAVIQVAIDRGVLAEEGGQLRIPEGQGR